jgi:hypothetical protein
MFIGAWIIIFNIESNLPIQSPVLSDHLEEKGNIFLALSYNNSYELNL